MNLIIMAVVLLSILGASIFFYVSTEESEPEAVIKNPYPNAYRVSYNISYLDILPIEYYEQMLRARYYTNIFVVNHSINKSLSQVYDWILKYTARDGWIKDNSWIKDDVGFIHWEKDAEVKIMYLVDQKDIFIFVAQGVYSNFERGD